MPNWSRRWGVAPNQIDLYECICPLGGGDRLSRSLIVEYLGIPVISIIKLDGRWLVRTSDDSLTPFALAYKQLLEVERGWRDLKGSLGLRPVFHHREDRIRAHVQLCWLGLLLMRVIENQTGDTTGDTWRNVRHELDRMHLVTMESIEGRVAQRANTTPGQAEIFKSLGIAEPDRFLDFEVPRPRTQSRVTNAVVTRSIRASTPVCDAYGLSVAPDYFRRITPPRYTGSIPN